MVKRTVNKMKNGIDYEDMVKAWYGRLGDVGKMWFWVVAIYSFILFCHSISVGNPDID